MVYDFDKLVLISIDTPRKQTISYNNSDLMEKYKSPEITKYASNQQKIRY